MEYGVATLAGTLNSPAIIVAWTLVAVAFLALGMVVYAAIRSRVRRPDLEKAVQAFRSLDIEAFRNLIDPSEEAFLRDHLPPRKFREIKRQRAWAAFLYAWGASKAANALAQVGLAAQRSSDPEMAASGVHLAENAYRLRLQTISSSFHLLTGTLLPGLETRPHPHLVDQYHRTNATLFRLGRYSAGSLVKD